MVSLGDGWETIQGDDSSLNMGFAKTKMGEAEDESNVLSKGENNASIAFSIEEEHSSDFSTEGEEE